MRRDAFDVRGLTAGETGLRGGVAFFATTGEADAADERAEAVERVDADETERLIVPVRDELSLALGVTRRERTDELVKLVALEASDVRDAVVGPDRRGVVGGTAAFATLGDLALGEVTLLVVEAVEVDEKRRARAALPAESSDLADLNAVDPSLAAEDTPDSGRSSAEGGRRPVALVGALLLRIVDACERTDVTEGGLGAERVGLSGTESPRVGRRAALERASDGDDSAVTTLDRSDDASDDVEGVSFESGRGPGGTTALRRAVVVVVLARETVEWVLRAAERTELADE